MGTGFFLRWLKCLKIDRGDSYTYLWMHQVMALYFHMWELLIVHCISVKTFSLIGPIFFLFLGGLSHMACGILVPQPGIKPQGCSPCTGRRSLNHWTTKEVHSMKTLKDETVLHTCVKISGSLFFSVDQGVDPFKHILYNKSAVSIMPSTLLFSELLKF